MATTISPFSTFLLFEEKLRNMSRAANRMICERKLALNRARNWVVIVSSIACSACAYYGNNSTDNEKTYLKSVTRPSHKDFIKALSDIDFEECRQSIDLCSVSYGRDDYDIKAVSCDEITNNHINCQIQEIRPDGIARKCNVKLAPMTNAGVLTWTIIRGRMGDDPRRLRATCKYQ